MITKEEVQHIAKLARIELADEELKKFQKDFSQILEFFETLKDVDVSDEKSTAYSIALNNVTRDDISRREKPEVVEKLIRMTPQIEGNYVKVPKVL
ncbi:MAG: aspartyl-tRNA(Asn)/glutamyl-tRNA (Gln) amidotransferase subunit C [Parcubacteria group bacterium Greene0714_21]|nr:MAG: aspartyl-tRNA(Asn)/glutamyl-tRNA (Gln) amidotransferase subunit C [Parcubacteria group bacterium Greene0416_39]TSC97742.1 MAG: aspartyl-tRNA(Asn)/glutamyl-tRNA (Gln) amidotransferase subunit C [Parcubacteria group bacterium Greene1014_47]TSD04335.1 MAG: aspartyl-tRNA(Asn)/glutamyl-tRNA (Gln) amidotransferase subunit C [Parcubacteria group bacterium Greene0714_21]